MIMVAVLAGILFSVALIVAVGTIALMGHGYHSKAVAALRLEHRPTRPAPIVQITYSPARRARFGGTYAERITTRAHRSVRAA